MKEVSYSFLSALKNNNRQGFDSCLGSEIFLKNSPAKLDYVFDQYRKAIEKYDLPTKERWLQQGINYFPDTVKRKILLGPPFDAQATNSSPDFYFRFHYTEDHKIDAMLLTPRDDFRSFPDSLFPLKETAFNFKISELEDIRIYYLPGVNTTPDSSRSVLWTNTELTGIKRKNIERLLSRINSVHIISSRKSEIRQEENTNDLRSCIISFKRDGRKLGLSIMNPAQKDKFLKFYCFYTLNTAVQYELPAEDQALLNEELKYLESIYVRDQHE
jgi:hypothetical protein